MTSSTHVARETRQTIPLPASADKPGCPKCGGPMWDNRLSKRNAKAPDFKCHDRSCTGVIWPNRRVVAPSVKVSDVAPCPNEKHREHRPAACLSKRYVELAEFVLQTVRPIYQQNGLACGEETVAAITATLFIGETRREGL